MKFLTYALLVGATAAVRLTQETVMSLTNQAHAHVAAQECPHQPSKAENEAFKKLEEWGKAELANGGTITKAEAQAKLTEIAAEYGVEIPEEVWTHLEAMFDLVDTNGDGELNAAEVEAVIKAHEGVEFPS